MMQLSGCVDMTELTDSRLIQDNDIGIIVSLEGSEVCEPTSVPAIPEDTSVMEVHYIDVGQGDCTLITCGGDAMLIDAGDNTKGTAVQKYLNEQGVSKLKYLVCTHHDADHIGGADVVITKFECETVFMTTEDTDTKTYRDVLAAMDYKRYSPTLPKVGERYTLGSAEFTIIAPAQLYDESNNNSISLILQHGENRFMFTGDSEYEAELAIAAAGIDISEITVYKAGHHGSYTSSSEMLLDIMNPRFAVISCGRENEYGHPHDATLTRLSMRGIDVFRTDEEGTIVAVSDGTIVSFNVPPSDNALRTD